MNSKRYNLVLYDEMDIIKFISASLNNRGKNISQIQYAYILHDRDDKKAHYHLFIEFPEAVKERDIERILTLVNVPTSSLSYEKTNSNFLAYLTHNTPQDYGVKASYEFSEIISNMVDLRERWEKAVEAVNKPSRQQQKLNEFTTIITNLYDVVNENTEIINIPSLTTFLLENGMMKELQYVLNKTYAIKSMFEVAFKTNSVYNATRAIKSKNEANLKALRNEFNEAMQQQEKMEEIEENIQCLKN